MKKINSYYIWLIFSLIVLTLIGIFSIRLPFRGDERHIVETIRLFADNFNFSTLKNYPEVTPPFFFMFYAVWAKIFGSSIESLRVLTLIISFITWQLVFYFNKTFVKNGIHAFLLSLLIIINPYFFGTGIFVFTDMLTILLSLAAIISFIKDRLFFFIVFSSLAILCRQYAVIFPIAVIVLWTINYFEGKPVNKKYLFGSLSTLFPLLMLFVIWGNIAPASGRQKWIVPTSSIYNVDYLNTYIAFSIVYLLPIVIIFFLKKIELSFFNLIIALAITTLLLQFPIAPSAAAILQTDIRTVGFAHLGLVKLFGNESFLLKLVLGVLLFAGCFINVVLIIKLLSNVRKKIYNKSMILGIIWILFLFIIPFSYQVWEKYLTLVLPFLILSIYLVIYPQDKSLNH